MLTEKGWLLIFCPADQQPEPTWGMAAALLDKDDPSKALATINLETPRPISAGTSGEGFAKPVVNNVTFPSGAIIANTPNGKQLRVYGGVDDAYCAMWHCDLNDLLAALEDPKNEYQPHKWPV